MNRTYPEETFINECNTSNLLILLTLTCACSFWAINPEHRYRLVFEEETPQELQDAITSAANDWQTATDSYITFTTDNDPNLPTITVHGRSSHYLWNEFHIIGGDTKVYLNSPNSDIYLPIDWSDDQNQQYLPLLCRHELGHSLGLKHYVTGTVMYSDFNGESTYVTCSDVDQLCALWGCDPRTMKPCQVMNH